MTIPLLPYRSSRTSCRSRADWIGLTHDGAAGARGAWAQRKNVQLLDLPLNEALVGLRHQQVDAVIQVIGAPADSIRDALLTDVSLRLVPLSERAVALTAASNAGYFAHTIPRGAYATQKQDVRTIATAALLLVGADLAESEVGALTVTCSERDEILLRAAAHRARRCPLRMPGSVCRYRCTAAKALDGLSKPTASPPASPAAPPPGSAGKQTKHGDRQEYLWAPRLTLVEHCQKVMACRSSGCPRRAFFCPFCHG